MPAQIVHRALTLAPKLISGMEPEGDRDAFIIVASDGVWEFISSQASLARVSHQLPQATAAAFHAWRRKLSCRSL